MPNGDMVVDLSITGDYLYTIESDHYAGQIEIAPGVRFSMTAMPNRFHRWMNRLVFGFQYHDWQGWAN